jgi:hypothetical protein
VAGAPSTATRPRTSCGCYQTGAGGGYEYQPDAKLGAD